LHNQVDRAEQILPAKLGETIQMRGLVALAAIRMLGLQSVVLTLVLALSSVPTKAQFPDVVVFAAASLRNALDAANSLFLFENGSGVKMTYGGSSTLARTIANGTPADVFIPDDNESMDLLAERKLIMPDTREKLLGNRLVLIARANSNTVLTIAPNVALAAAIGTGRLALLTRPHRPPAGMAKPRLKNSGCGRRSPTKWRWRRMSGLHCNWSRAATQRSASSTRPTWCPTGM